jgi:Tol biopolymer transport system component
MAYSLFGGKSFLMDLRKPWSEQTPIETALIDNRENTHFVASAWSPDGKYLVGSGYDNGRRQGLFTYSIETRSYEGLSEFGLNPKWLADSKRFLFAFENRIFLSDTLSKKPREIFSFDPDWINGLDVSKDNRSIYISVATTEADIWLLSL